MLFSWTPEANYVASEQPCSFNFFVGNWTTSEDKPDPSSNSGAVILHKAHSRNSHGWDFAFWLYLHPAFLYSQQYLVRNAVCPEVAVSCCCLPVLLRRCPFYVVGHTRCTTCLDSCFWFSLSWSSPALRQQFCSATSTFVRRYCIVLPIHVVKCSCSPWLFLGVIFPVHVYCSCSMLRM